MTNVNSLKLSVPSVFHCSGRLHSMSLLFGAWDSHAIRVCKSVCKYQFVNLHVSACTGSTSISLFCMWALVFLHHVPPTLSVLVLVATPSVCVHTKSIYVSTTKRLTGKCNYTWQSLLVFHRSEVLLGIWIIVIFLLDVNNDLEIDCHMQFIINKNVFSSVKCYPCFLDHEHRKKYLVRKKRVVSYRKMEYLRKSIFLAWSEGYSAVVSL